MCSGSEAGSYLRLIDFVYHTTLGLRVIKKKKRRLRVSTARPLLVSLVLGVWSRVSESKPLMAVHLSRHKWPEELVN